MRRRRSEGRKEESRAGVSGIQLVLLERAGQRTPECGGGGVVALLNIGKMGKFAI